MDVKKILKEATDNGASDIFIVAGRPLTYKSKGVMECLNEIRMIPKETFEFVTSIYALAERDISKFEETGDADCENAQEQDDVVAFFLKKFPEAVGFGMFIVLHGLHLLSLVLPRLWKHIPANERIILPWQARARVQSSGPDSI